MGAKSGSEFTEFGFVDTYAYGSGFIRRRNITTKGILSEEITTQTLDTNDRVIKEVHVDVTTATIWRTIEITYDGNRKEGCEVSVRDPRRQCATTVLDPHGNEVEVVAGGKTTKRQFEYDSTGNWITQRTVVTGPFGTSVDMIVRRKIEYW